MTEATSPERNALRDVVLGGLQAAAGWDDDVAAALVAFLRDDRAALGRWFGDRVFPDEPHLAARAVRGAIDRDLLAIDAAIARQLDAILHHPRLQRLEGSWRAVRRLADGAREAPVRIRLLTATWATLDRDLGRALEFDQSHLFRLVYEQEFGQAGGEPYGLLLIDHEVSHKPSARTAAGGAPVDDVAVMRQLAAVAAAAFVPTILGAAPALLGADRFSDLALSQDPTAILGDADHGRWRAMAEAEEARFLGATLPRLLARRPWTRRETGGWYEEYAPTETERCWCVAGYALAANVIRAHAAHRWPADIRGVTRGRVGGGLVTDLVEDDFRFGAETRLRRGETDLVFTDAQERALLAANLITLNLLPGEFAAFGSVRSLQTRETVSPGRRITAASANRRVSGEINAMLCASRFAHYVKIIGRDLTGRHATAEEIERELQTWLRGYTNANVSPGAGSRARHPLLSSRVEVVENPGRPGSFGCVIHLQPFYQLDDVSTTLRLTTNLAVAEGPGRAGPIDFKETA